MNIPSEMRAQISERKKLFDGMQAAGVIPNPIEYLEVPMLLVMHLSNDDLDARLAALKRTRRRAFDFQLNGRLFVLSRRTSIDLVSAEKECRREQLENATALEVVGPNVADNRYIAACGVWA